MERALHVGIGAQGILALNAHRSALDIKVAGGVHLSKWYRECTCSGLYEVAFAEDGSIVSESNLIGNVEGGWTKDCKLTVGLRRIACISHRTSIQQPCGSRTYCARSTGISY